MQTGKPCNELTERINTAVLEARKREEWRSDYMRMDTRDAGREEERENTERERKRADMAEERAESEKNRADIAEARVRELEALLYSVKS